MADTTRRFLANQHLDLEQILQEAKNRWLRPPEICEILRNYQSFYLTPDPPVRPPAGSLFLFDRKALRYFRKDGHRWRKKKDGKTVREAHEKLKAGSVDVLHCYYAHGEENESFQRRSYWMLDGQLEHIVLVHYREVKEGYKSGISRLINTDPVTQTESPPFNSLHCVSKANSAAFTAQASYASSPSTGHWPGQTLSSEFDEGDSGYSDLSPNPLSPEFAGTNFNTGASSAHWDQICISGRHVDRSFGHQFHFEQPRGADTITHKLVDANSAPQDVTRAIRLTSTDGIQAVSAICQRVGEVCGEHDFRIVHPQFQNRSDCHLAIASASQVDNHRDGKGHDESLELKKLDSFGRWMVKEIGVDCDDSLMASDSSNYWNTLGTQNDDKEVSSLSRQMQLDVDSLAPSLSREQLFSIGDFSPDWAYTGVETKVLIAGTFLGNTKHSATKWCCMFGEIEVPAEVLTSNVIRCQAPSHAPGRVPFYVTCSNRLACSEVREFEYRENLFRNAFSIPDRITLGDELRLQIRLAKMLLIDMERKWLNCSVEDCDKCKLKAGMFAIKSSQDDDWQTIEAACMAAGGNKTNPRDALFQNLLKDRLFEWLICKVHEGGKGPNIWDEGGQGVIHMASALGYDWAIGSIVLSGVSPNFRDAQGRTGLHWASFFGREDCVLALVSVGADPGAVDDPKPTYPGGQTAADLASSRGHKGIAGYLAEAHLTRHLSLLNINESLDSGATVFVAEKETNTVHNAVRKSAQAAALIQAAFHARSFRHQQLMSSHDRSDVSLDLVALGSLNKVQKLSNFNDYLHSAAAVKIQQKYRGWKGRKEFLKIRNRIVKIQAHVRGHQVRKQYKKVVWSVSIVEKAILRWRRKGSGLRGFKVEKAILGLAPETEKTDEYEYLKIGQKQKFVGVENALARVKSMARSPEAREQYMRLITKFGNFEICGKDGDDTSGKESVGKNPTVEDLLALKAD